MTARSSICFPSHLTRLVLRLTSPKSTSKQTSWFSSPPYPVPLAHPAPAGTHPTTRGASGESTFRSHCRFPCIGMKRSMLPSLVASLVRRACYDWLTISLQAMMSKSSCGIQLASCSPIRRTRAPSTISSTSFTATGWAYTSHLP